MDLPDQPTSVSADSNLLRSFAANVDWIYAGLIRLAESDPNADTECGLAGRLLYADELEGAGNVLVVAAKIAGAASLAATDNTRAQSQAIRNGVINCVVPSVGHALEILHKRSRISNPVAVCVSQPPHVVEHDMAAIGVLPDLLPPGALNATRLERFLVHGARKIEPVSASHDQTILTWSVDRWPARWLPKLDLVALDCLCSFQSRHGCTGLDTWSARRWLNHAPRHLGRLARGMRLLRCPNRVAHDFLGRVRRLMTAGMLDVTVEIDLCSRGELEYHRVA